MIVALRSPALKYAETSTYSSSAFLGGLQTGRLPFTTSMELWQNADAESFGKEIWQHTCRSLVDALSSATNSLLINIIYYNSGPQRQLVKINSLDEDDIPRVPIDSQYAFEIAGDTDEQLLLLAETSMEIQLLAPAPWHKGIFNTGKERVPSELDRWFEFDDYSGHYRFIAIAIESSSTIPQLISLSNKDRRLRDSELWRLATYLVNNQDQWRWGETSVQAER